MKGRLCYKRAVVLFIFSILSVLTISMADSCEDELIPAGDVIELDVPSDEQILMNSSHDVAMAANRTFVVTWVYQKEGTSFSDLESEHPCPFPVYARRFDANGTPLTDIVEVNSAVLPEEGAENRIIQYNPKVATDAGGDFIVCWTKLRQMSGRDTVQFSARLFDSEGIPKSDEIVICDEFYASSFRMFPSDLSVAMNAAGKFVVTWNGEGTGDYYDENCPIYMKRFDSEGNALDDAPVRVNPDILSPDWSYFDSKPSVAMDWDGNCAIAWSVYKTVLLLPGTFTITQMVQPFNPDGSPSGSAREVSASAGNNIFMFSETIPWPSDEPPSVAMNSFGDFAVSYFQWLYDPAYRFFSSSGLAQGAGRKMGVVIDSEKIDSAMDDDGNLTMGWFGCNDSEHCEEEAIYLMQVSKDPAKPKRTAMVAEPLPYDPMASSARSDLSNPALDVSPEGLIVVIWHDDTSLLGRLYTSE